MSRLKLQAMGLDHKESKLERLQLQSSRAAVPEQQESTSGAARSPWHEAKVAWCSFRKDFRQVRCRIYWPKLFIFDLS